MADSSLVAHVITKKIMKYVPLYHQEKFFSIKGLDIIRKNMSNWLMMATNYLRPLFELMHKDILNNDIVLTVGAGTVTKIGPMLVDNHED